MTRLRFLLPLLGILAALGIATVQAQTTATQNVSFTASAAVGIVSNADVAFGTLTTNTTKTGTLTVNSNDGNGISLTTNPAGPNYSSGHIGESGVAPCVATASFATTSITLTPHALTGQTAGTGGTPAAPFAMSGAVQSLFSVNPTGTGPAMTLSVDYTVNLGAIPANTNACQYTWQQIYTVAAL